MDTSYKQKKKKKISPVNSLGEKINLNVQQKILWYF